MYVNFLSSIAYLARVDPLTYNLKMIFFGDEGYCLVNTEHAKLFVTLVFLSLAQEKVRDFFIKLGHSFRWEIDLGCENKGAIQGVYQVLIVFIHKLVHNNWHSSRWICKLSHH